MMTDTNIIIEVAKLDGWFEPHEIAFTVRGYKQQPTDYPHSTDISYLVPDYLTSHDAIIPVIEKLWYSNGFKPEDFYKALPQYIMTPLLALFITPRDLSITLLKATGNWKE